MFKRLKKDKRLAEDQKYKLALKVIDEHSKEELKEEIALAMRERFGQLDGDFAKLRASK